MDTSEKLIKAFSDAIPLGPHPQPHSEWIQVRLDFVLEAIDHIEWLEKGVAEWRSLATVNHKQTAMLDASCRVAIRHLHAVLNQCRSHGEQQAADTAARDWLESIGSEPS